MGTVSKKTLHLASNFYSILYRKKQIRRGTKKYYIHCYSLAFCQRPTSNMPFCSHHLRLQGHTISVSATPSPHPPLCCTHIFPLLLLLMSTLMPGGNRRFPALMSDVKRTFPSLITEEISSDSEETPVPQSGRLFSTEAFPVALESIPTDNWGRTWASVRTIMLKRTSKRVKQQVDKMLLSVVVHLSSSFAGASEKNCIGHHGH